MRRGRILVIRGGAIGDFILTLPAVAALRHQFSGAHLELLGYPHIASLAMAGGLVNHVQPIEARGLAGFFAEGGALNEAMSMYFASFDLIVSYLYDPDEIFRRNVASCTRAQFIQGPHRPDERQELHATRVFLKPLERLAIFDADPVPRLVLEGPATTAPVLALHPGSGSERKNWPETHWRKLLTHLTARTDFTFLLVGGEAEGDRLERLASALPAGRLTLARSLPLVELAGRLRSCRGFVGHDSGITHLAAALGVPCVALWTDTNREVWRPLGAAVFIVDEAGATASVAVEQVWEALAACCG